MNQRLIWNFEIDDAFALPLPDLSSLDPTANGWEARYFWADNVIIPLHGLPEATLELSRYKIKHVEDHYWVLPEKDYNLKMRRNELFYKPIIERNPYAVAYGKKINITTAQETHLNVEDYGVPDSLRADLDRNAQQIKVAKDILVYPYLSSPLCSVELVRLRIKNRVYFSLSIESKALALVQYVARGIVGNKQPCDYITFLKNPNGILLG